MAPSGPTEYQAVLGLFVSVFVQLALLSVKLSQKPSASNVVEGSDESTGLPSIDQAMTLIKARRSIKPKDFSKEPITKQEIMTLLEAANWAPSHGKTESWRFTVVHGERALKELVDVTCGIFRSLGNKEKEEYVRKEFTTGKFKQIQCIIFIGMKRKSIPDKTMPEWEEICSVASAVQNMQLAGTASGIHGYWSSWFDGALEHANTAKYLGLDFKAGDKCLGCLLLGKATPDRVAGYRGSKRPVETKVTFK